MGQNTGSRDFSRGHGTRHAGHGHDGKALSENSFQHIGPPTAFAKEQSCHGSRIAAARARIRSGCPDLESKRVCRQGRHFTFMPHDAQQATCPPSGQQQEHQAHKKEQTNSYIVV